MRQLTVAAGILILVGLLVTCIQRDSILGSGRAISTAGQSPGSKRYPTQGSVMM